MYTVSFSYGKCRVTNIQYVKYIHWSHMLIPMWYSLKNLIPDQCRILVYLQPSFRPNVKNWLLGLLSLTYLDRTWNLRFLGFSLLSLCINFVYVTEKHMFTWTDKNGRFIFTYDSYMWKSRFTYIHTHVNVTPFIKGNFSV